MSSGNDWSKASRLAEADAHISIAARHADGAREAARRALEAVSAAGLRGKYASPVERSAGSAIARTVDDAARLVASAASASADIASVRRPTVTAAVAATPPDAAPPKSSRDTGRPARRRAGPSRAGRRPQGGARTMTAAASAKKARRPAVYVPTRIPKTLAALRAPARGRAPIGIHHVNIALLANRLEHTTAPRVSDAALRRELREIARAVRNNARGATAEANHVHRLALEAAQRISVGPRSTPRADAPKRKRGGARR